MGRSTQTRAACAVLLAALACGRTQPYQPQTFVSPRPDAGTCVCPAHAHCLSPNGPCACDDGFELRGDECIAIQLCEGVVCEAHAHCGVLGPVGRCDCDEGYERDGGQCLSIAGSLDRLRWELPCLSPWDQAPEWVCVTRPDQTTLAKLSGRPGATYEIALRLRGVVETEAYVGGVGDGGLVLRGGTPNGDAWNVYRLDISSPAQRWHLNNGPSGLYTCVAVDVPLTVTASAGATFTLFASAVDSSLTEIRNHGPDGGVIVVPGVAPFPASFDGQFLQMDVLSVREH